MLARYVPGRRATVSMGKTGTSSYMSPTLSLLWSAHVLDGAAASSLQ